MRVKYKSKLLLCSNILQSSSRTRDNYDDDDGGGGSDDANDNITNMNSWGET